MRPFEVIVLVSGLSGRGVCCRVEGNPEPFWLPVAGPAQWLEIPMAGTSARVRLPRWLANKHSQLLKLRGQYALPLQPEVALDPERANKEGSFPVTDFPPDAGKGYLSRDPKHEAGSKRPEFTGKISIHGVEYRLAAWVREKDGKRYFALTAREAGQAQQQHQPQQAPQRQATSYAAAKSGERAPVDEAIPF